MSNLTYEELVFPNFINRHAAITVGIETKIPKINPETGMPIAEKVVLPFDDAPKICVFSGVPFLNIGDTRCGKSRMMRDIAQFYFGGESDFGGRSHLEVARNDFTAEGYFMTTDQSKIGEGKGLLAEARVPNERRIKALCNLMDEINGAIPEVQIEFFGMAEGRHKSLILGSEGYYLFIASCNLNRVNGDFVGVSAINRALLNRMGVTLDHDFYKITDADLDLIMSRPKNETTRDISDKILEAHREIATSYRQSNPLLDVYLRLFSSGLDYCEKDQEHAKKRAWPTKCGSCDFGDKEICSQVKQSNTGTIELVKRFALGINYLVQLKYPDKKIISVDAFDMAREAFKFTTYHGNLNAMETMSTYAGEDQEQMNAIVGKVETVINPMRDYIDPLVASAMTGNPETRFIQVGGLPVFYTQATEQECKKQGISYSIIDAKQKFNEFGSRYGLRLDWLPDYLESLAKKVKP